jgi:hypothetical protein
LTVLILSLFTSHGVLGVAGRAQSNQVGAGPEQRGVTVVPLSMMDIGCHSDPAFCLAVLTERVTAKHGIA